MLRLGEYQLYKPGESKAEQARASSHKLGDYRMEANSFNLLGFFNLESKDFHLAIAFHQVATNLFCPLP